MDNQNDWCHQYDVAGVRASVPLKFIRAVEGVLPAPSLGLVPERDGESFGVVVNWSDERYVRLFTRDTVTWLRWSFETRAVFCLLLRKVDRSGVLETGRDDKAEALALTLMAPIEACRKALSELMACGTVAASDTSLVIPRFIEAQECRMSDKARQKESREKRAVAKLENHDDACHTPSHAVTAGHTVSQLVTPAVPSRAVPSRAVEQHVSVPTLDLQVQSPPDNVADLRQAWNDITTAPLPRWREGRDWVARAALKRRPLEQWREVFARINASAFCRGQDGGWKADIDWALRPEGKKPETATRVLEGAFDASPVQRDVTKGYAPPSVFTETKEVLF